jgi:hypothetical protein
LDTTGKKSLGTLFALGRLLLFALHFAPSRYIISTYTSRLLMASEIDVYETEPAVGHVLIVVSFCPSLPFLFIYLFFFYIQVSFESLEACRLVAGFRSFNVYDIRVL